MNQKQKGAETDKQVHISTIIQNNGSQRLTRHESKDQLIADIP